ncbi:MAG: hypothetical protein R3E08_11260 [Thiotrichaceae bacterium]
MPDVTQFKVLVLMQIQLIKILFLVVKSLNWRLHATGRVNSDLEGARIVREGLRYFLIPCLKRKICANVRKPRLGAVALDPGVRTFVTFYSEDLHTVSW